LIRPATPADAPAITRLLADFDAASGARVDAPGESFAAAHVARGVAARIAHRLGLVLVLDLGAGPVGVLVAEAGAGLWRPALWADELAFWIDPAARGPWADRFLAAYEAWARDLGARLVGLSSLGPRAEQLYTRRGYEPADRKFVKVI